MLTINSNSSKEHVSIDMAMLAQPTSQPKQITTSVASTEQFCSDLVSYKIVPKLLQNQQGQLLQQPALHHCNLSTDERSRCYPHLDITLKKIIEAYRRPQPNEPFWRLAQCPITLEPFVAPIRMADGHTYEHQAIIDNAIANSSQQHTFLLPLIRQRLLPAPQLLNLRLLEIALYGRIVEQKPIEIKQMVHVYEQANKKDYLLSISRRFSFISKFIMIGITCAWAVWFLSTFNVTMKKSELHGLELMNRSMMITSQFFSLFFLLCTRHSSKKRLREALLSCQFPRGLISLNDQVNNYSKKRLQQINLALRYQRALQAVQQDILTLQLQQAAL